MTHPTTPPLDEVKGLLEQIKALPEYDCHDNVEPLSIIAANECEHQIDTLVTRRFRRVFNALREIARAYVVVCEERDALIQAAVAAGRHFEKTSADLALMTSEKEDQRKYANDLQAQLAAANAALAAAREALRQIKPKTASSQDWMFVRGQIAAICDRALTTPR